MCVSKEEAKELLSAVGKVKHDTGNIRQAQDAQGQAIDKMEKHLKTLNSRTSKLEGKVDNLEDDDVRGARCIQKDVIARIEKNMLTVDKFEAWEKEKERKKKEEAKKAREEELHNFKKASYIIGGIVALGTLATTIIAFFV